MTGADCNLCASELDGEWLLHDGGQAHDVIKSAMLLKLSSGQNGGQPSSAQLTYVEYADHHVPLREPAAGSMPRPMQFRPRRRWQSVFLRWYSDNQDRFVIKLELLKRTDTHLYIGFGEISRVITAMIRHNQIAIYAEWLGFCWDILREFETFPKKVSGGYTCSQCPEDNRPVFDSSDALRRAEVLEPFLEWVNGDLANAAAVSLSGTPDEASWARLVPKIADTKPQAFW
jgi:hypothetical protein